MKTLFFYGTMRHFAVLEIVLGRSVAKQDLEETQLQGYQVSAVAEGPFPMIAAHEGAIASGIAVRDLSEADIARMDFYEGSFAYDLTPVTLANGTQAEVYVPQPGLWTPAGPWDLQEWSQDWGEISEIAAQEVMGYFGTRSRDAVARMFPVIRTRAASRVRAAASTHGRDTFRGRVEIDKRTRSYSDFYALDDFLLRHEQFDGTMSETLDRAVFVGTDATLVLPYDPVRDRVLVVEQVRLGPIGRGDRTQWQWEPIAGRIDPGETPQAAARREAREEAGLTLGALEQVAAAYPSPGTSTEFHYVYLGLTDLPDDSTGTGGLADENEDIRSHIMSFDALMQRVESFDLANAPLVMGAYYLARHRDRLRSAEAADTPDRTIKN